MRCRDQTATRTDKGQTSALMRPSEVAAHLNVTVATLESWRARNVPLRYVRLSGRAVRYQREDVQAFLAARSVNPEGEAA